MIDPLGDSEFGFLLEVSTEKEREREQPEIQERNLKIKITFTTFEIRVGFTSRYVYDPDIEGNTYRKTQNVLLTTKEPRNVFRVS